MTAVGMPELADGAGLRYVEPGSPGYRRVRRGRGFSFVDEGGDVASGRVRSRITSLAIPPAWEEVWISRDPQGHILATGRDRAGRRQYIYHPLWEQVRDEAKFERLGAFGSGLARLRSQMDSDLRKRGLSRQKVVALAVAVLDRTLIRVGNSEYALDNESYGLTTLTCDHLAVDGRHVHLEFSGKGGVERQLVFEDRRLADLLSGCEELSGQTLFSYETDEGEIDSITSSDVNEYLSDTLQGPFSAKDFRTWGASSLVVGELARSDPGENQEERLRYAIDVAAERLGNSRAVCRDSYVHPKIIGVSSSELSDRWRRARGGKWVDREESALRLLLDE